LRLTRAGWSLALRRGCATWRLQHLTLKLKRVAGGSQRAQRLQHVRRILSVSRALRGPSRTERVSSDAPRYRRRFVACTVHVGGDSGVFFVHSGGQLRQIIIGRPCCTFGPVIPSPDLSQFMRDEMILLTAPPGRQFRMLNMLSQAKPTLYQSNGSAGIPLSACSRLIISANRMIKETIELSSQDHQSAEIATPCLNTHNLTTSARGRSSKLDP
jgi:hypothetical protein